jgi:hypothetical protein
MPPSHAVPPRHHGAAGRLIEISFSRQSCSSSLLSISAERLAMPRGVNGYRIHDSAVTCYRGVPAVHALPG